MIPLQVAGSIRQHHIATHEYRLRVRITKRLQQLITIQQLQGEFREAHLGIHIQHRGQPGRIHTFLHKSIETGAEGIYHILMNHQTGGHIMATTGYEGIGTGMNSLHQRYARNGATTALTYSVLIQRNNEGGLMIAAHEKRSHDTHHTRMPGAGAQHYHAVALR